LRRSELLLGGQVHPEIEPYLKGVPDSVKLLGFQRQVEKIYRQSSIFVFPSRVEGSAKSTYEAVASSLVQITTKDSGDVVMNVVNGIVIPSEDAGALPAAILRLCENQLLLTEMSMAGRKRAMNHFTLDHFRQRVRTAYRTVFAKNSLC